MSIGETLIIAVIFLIVFGPKKLPQLSQDIARFLFKIKTIKQQLSENYQQTMQHQQLNENEKKASTADLQYDSNKD